MDYQIKYDPFPIVLVNLKRGEEILCQSGAMAWYTPSLEMQTTSNGGLGKMFGRAFTGEAMFMNKYIARNDGYISLTSGYVGTIVPVKIERGKDIVVQKSGFLASYGNIEMSVFFQKKLGAGLFGGEGILMQRLSGNGIAFLEIDGAVHEQELATGEKLILDTGYLAAMDASCKMDVQGVKGVKNVLFGGEGFFNTIVTGPGKVYIQTKPISGLAASLRPFFSTSSNS